MDASSTKKGRIALRGEHLLVSFSYDKRRFNKIRQLSGAVYDKELKQWVLPLKHLKTLEDSKLFSRAALFYGFDLSKSKELIDKQAVDIEGAKALLKRDPFCVSEHTIEILNLDIVFRLNRFKKMLLAYPNKAEAKKLLVSIPGVHYLRNEHAFFFPTIQLVSLIRVLKEKHVTFAVEESAGIRLKSTAKKRARIIAGDLKPSEKDLLECLLVPYVVPLGNHLFSLRCATNEQLRDCFPSVSHFAERRKISASMNKAVLNGMISSSVRTATKVWFVAGSLEACDKVDRLIKPEGHAELKSIPDESLFQSCPELIWGVDDKERAGLILTQESLEGLLEVGAKLDRKKLVPCAQIPEHIFYPIDNSSLNDFRLLVEGLLSPDVIPVTSSFQDFLLNMKRRERALHRQRCYHNIKDCNLRISDNELRTTLFPHQRVAVKWLLNSSYALLGDEMGLGKTLSVLTSFWALKERNEVDFLLVVSPNSLTRNWQREAKNWIRGMQLLTLPAKKKDRQKLLSAISSGNYSRCDGVVVNYEAFRLDDVFPGFLQISKKFRTMLCLDESQRTKNINSKIFKALSFVSPFCSRRVLLSGTPTPKDITDIWAQMYLLDGGERLGKNFYEWLPSVAEVGTKWSRVGIKRLIPEGVNETISRVHEILLRRRKEEVVNLPEKLFSVRDISLKGDQLKRYEEVRKELLLRVTSSTGETFLRQIDSILEEYLRAVQIASNPRLVDPNWQGEPAKFLELDEIVREVVEEQSRKIVIWTNYLLNVDELVARYSFYGSSGFTGKLSGDQRAKIVQDFQSNSDSSYKVFIAIPAAGGVGITLTAAQTAVYVDKTWNAEYWFQSVDRIHRIGQAGTVNIISLHAGKVDDFIARNLMRKGKEQSRLMGDDGSDQTEIYRPSREELLMSLSNAEEIVNG